MNEAEFHQKWNNDTRYKDHAAVYAAFGINKADVTGMIDGVVWKDGRVTLADGTLVATNATTAGRWNNPTSDMTKIPNASRAYKMSTRHFVTEGQTAMIKMVDGQFKFAIIKSCGNPVVAAPQPKPVFSCDLIKATVDPKNIYKYNFTINATAKGGAKVHDYVINYGDGTATQLSKTNAFSHTYTKAGTYTIKSSVRINLFGEVKTVTNTTCQTTITITEPKKPRATCEELKTPVITDRTRVSLSSRASVADGATISEHIFTIHDASGTQINQRRVATTATTASSVMEVPAAGNYTAKVAIRTSLGDIRSANCEKPFTIVEEDKPGISVTKKVDGVDHKAVDTNVEFTYQLRVSNTGQADLKNVVVNDTADTGVTFIKASHGTVSQRTWTYTIPELKKGARMDFTITAKVPEYKAGIIKNTVCVDAPTIPGNPDDCDDATVEVPKDIIVCVLEGKKYPVTIKEEDFDETKHTTDFSKCADEPEVPPVTPPELPKTGAADSLLNALGLGALVTSGLAYIASRRHNLL
ncbi:hypothetical protein B7Z17_01390 [Candidatus Saccharibacteria bacterium 32-49-10]|nr:MAG: hypothetical protein B7Z17_01390 [Candidatus Saccharibacteria bacterium 32-49-10]